MFTDLGPSVYPSPHPLRGDVASLKSLDCQVVHVAGIPRETQIDPGGRRSFVVAVRQVDTGQGTTSRLTVIRDFNGADSQMVDAEIEFNAVLMITTDLSDNIIGFRLVSPDLESLRIAKKPADPETLPRTTVAALTQRSSSLFSHRVKVSGRVANRAGSAELELVDSTGSVPLTGANRVVVSTQQVDIIGFLTHESGSLSLQFPTVVPGSTNAETTSATSNNRNPKQNRALLTLVSQVRSLSPETADLARPVLLDGVITYWDQLDNICFFADKSAGIYVNLHGSKPKLPVQAGDHVLVSGVTGAGSFAPVIRQASFQVLGRGNFPIARSITQEDIFGGGADGQWVDLDGVIQNTGYYGARSVAT